MFCDFQQDVGINAVVHVCELSEQSLCRVIQSSYSLLFCVIPFTHTHTCLTALFPGLPGSAGTRKVKPCIET